MQYLRSCCAMWTVKCECMLNNLPSVAKHYALVSICIAHYQEREEKFLMTRLQCVLVPMVNFFVDLSISLEFMVQITRYLMWMIPLA